MREIFIFPFEIRVTLNQMTKTYFYLFGECNSYLIENFSFVQLTTFSPVSNDKNCNKFHFLFCVVYFGNIYRRHV